MPEVRYMRKKGESAVHIATEWLEKRDDMEFCDPIIPILRKLDDLTYSAKDVIAPETRDEKPLEQKEINVPRDTIYEASLAQKNLAESETLSLAKEQANNNFMCPVESCGKVFQNFRALRMHKMGAHEIGRKKREPVGEEQKANV